MKVPFFEYPRFYSNDKDTLLKVIDDVGNRGAFIMQQDLKDFELELAKFCNSDFSIGVANGTDALELALMAIGLKQGDEVIISSHTMVATASAIVTAGGVPIPVDIGYDNLIDPDSIESAITKNTVGIMPTQLNGRTCDMDKICKIANKHGLFIVEDSAQALGSKFKGKNAGTFGLAGGISFFPAKVLGCLGDGGGVLIQDKEIYHKVFQLHDHGRDTDGDVKSWGRNSRLDNLNAAILLEKLKTYPNVIERRRQIAGLYQALLGDMEELKLPPSPGSEKDHFDVFQNYEIEAKDRDALRLFLSDHEIGTLIQWGGKAIHQFECFGFNCDLPKTDSFFKNCIMLPMNMFITDDDVEYIASTIRNFYRS